MTDIPFVPPLEVRYGAVEQVSPRIRRVVAENPSRFTYRGTGTYVIGQGRVAVIDPGPVLDSHRDALAAALAGEQVTHIFVTHCHADHSPLAAWLREETGAPTLAFGPHGAVDPDDEVVLRGGHRPRVRAGHPPGPRRDRGRRRVDDRARSTPRATRPTTCASRWPRSRPCSPATT